ncbi:response regulator [Photobacterium gaetbulicola]|uniref:Transcriptional regulatory protein n=2 Tax=Photobacterium gaetbulicola TaxID=1295392 RepID=A0A0C5WR75_9GAMM|nr:response regulator [Photobacterium gaetbulicola]AJR05460.1 response regulator receiver/unknown domain-containing protein [Photobacterium gaetbulicola Gung47]KHT62976.1 chemotaxis protein CheY [Photobacterium gaetbulicola]PSU12779.1 response regulator [Photobacterium gaetbulicola]
MTTTIRIVIAEDDPQIAEIQRRFIERIDGFEVIGIAHGIDEARDLIEVLKPELVLLDNQFPTGTGLALLRELRAGGCNTDVILVTAATEVDTLRQAMHSGIFDYILKPLVFERLQASLLKFRGHLERFSDIDSLLQSDVDGLLQASPDNNHSPANVANNVAGRLPKGIDGLTLDKIRAVFYGPAVLLNAEEVGQQIGASRTTARRYLEYLVSTDELSAEVSYGSVGRPERRYQLC